MAKTPSPKDKKPPEFTALDLYLQNGCTLEALKLAMQHGIQSKEKDLAKTFKKQLFQAAGLDQYRLHCQNQTELQAVLNLSLAIVDKNDNPNDWLDILQQPDYWNAVKLTAINDLLNKAVTRLATHIPKTRNPANEGAPRFNKSPSQDNSAISANEASLAIATIEGDATLVGARFFFEFVFYLENQASSVLGLLLNRDDTFSAYLQQIGMDANTINRWQNTVGQLPRQLSPLQAQLLLKDDQNQWLSVTPMLSVASSSWLGHWRREVFMEINDQEILTHEGARPLYAIESVEYGGTNARNVAAILMDFSGKQQHPKILPPRVKRDTSARLERLLHQPTSLINPKKLYGKTLKALSNTYDDLRLEQRTQLLTSVIDGLLEDLLEDITYIKSLLDSEHEEALAFQSLLSSIATNDPYLQYALGNASKEQIKDIGNAITAKWLGPLKEFKAEEGHVRYDKIKSLVTDRLQAYISMEEET